MATRRFGVVLRAPRSSISRTRLCWVAVAAGALLIGVAVFGLMSRSPEAERVESLRAASFPIRTIDPAEGEFDDLLPLRQIIGERRFVLMTETTHDDGATFDARTRLIRFLHQKMGFDVVSVERSYAMTRELHQSMKTAEGYDAFFRRNPDYYLATAQRPLMDYVRSTQNSERPIALMGHGVYYCEDTDLTAKLRRFMNATELRAFSPAQDERFKAILKPLTTGSWPSEPPSSEEIADFEELISILTKHVQNNREALSKATSVEEVAYFEALVRSLPAFVRSMTMHMPHDLRDRDQLNQRDKAMADLIIRSSHDLFPDRKMVILSASAHLLSGEGFTPNPLRGITSMGENLRRAFGPERTYTIVFEAYSGKRGRPPGTPIREASPRTLAGLFQRVGDPYRFLDFSRLPGDHWLRRKPLGIRAHSYTRDGYSAIGPDVCDGVFYIEQMYPVH